MIPDENPEFGRDHNNPPGLLATEEAVASLQTWLNVVVQQPSGKTFAERKEEFLRAARNAVVRDRATAGSAADIIKLASRVGEIILAERKSRTDPYRDTASALINTAAEFWGDVEEAMQGLKDRIDEWTRIEDERIAQQAREQEEEMARLRAKSEPARQADTPAAAPLDYTTGAGQSARTGAAPTAPKRRRIQGDLGALVSETKTTEYVVSDVRALPDYILNAPGVHAAIIQAVKGTAKVMGVPAGITTTTTTGNSIR